MTARRSFIAYLSTDASQPRRWRVAGAWLQRGCDRAVAASARGCGAGVASAPHHRRVSGAIGENGRLSANFLNIRALFALALAVIALITLPTPARADDVAATGRSVVRVVLIASDNGRIVGYSHGTGVAVGPNRVVTNAHVVELSQRFPDKVVIGVVPSEGDQSSQGQVVAYDPQRDLALIEFKGARLPAATLYIGPIGDGDPVTALGYPGNVDLATARSAEDYIRPMTPVRGSGIYSGLRQLAGVQVLVHSAQVARGNSGGPLLDRCGRVLGINSALTRGDEGDASFGFAISNPEVIAFLREAKQAVATTGAPCTSIEERLSRDRDADARALDEAADQARQAEQKAAQNRAEARQLARDAAVRTRENVMGLAALLLVAGALGLGAGGLLETRGDRRRAIWAAGGGGALMLAAILTFVLRPTGNPAEPAPVPSASATTAVATGQRVCTIDPDRSRVTVSDTADVTIDWRGDGCINGRTQYAETEGGRRWQRILVPAEDQAVSVLAYDPAAETYSNTRYLLSATQMAAARKLRAGVQLKTCLADGPERANLATQQAAIRDALPAVPNEKLVYRCKVVP